MVKTLIFDRKTYNNFADFENEFKQYCDATFQIYSKATSRKMPNSDQYEYVEYKCIYHKDPNSIKAKGSGLRPMQSYQAKKCSAAIRVNIVKLIYLIVKLKLTNLIID